MDKIILISIAVLIVLIILYGLLFIWQNQKVLAPDVANTLNNGAAISSTALPQR